MQIPLDAREVMWEDLKQHVYNVDGSWRDIYVLDATREDWEKWVDFVNANYRVVFNDQVEERCDQIDFATVLNFWNSSGNGDALMPFSMVFVGEISVKCHFFICEEIENDIDPKEIDSYAAHLQLMDYMTRLSQVLGKQVVLTGENDSPTQIYGNAEWTPLISVHGDQVQIHPY